MLHCWAADDGKELWRAKADANYLAFSPDGRLIVSSDHSGGASFHLWDAATGGAADHGKPPKVNGAVQFSPDGDALAVYTPDGLVIWDLKTDKERRRIPKAAGPVVFSSDGRTLTGQVGEVLQRWNVETGETLYSDTFSRGQPSACRSGSRN